MSYYENLVMSDEEKRIDAYMLQWREDRLTRGEIIGLVLNTSAYVTVKVELVEQS